MLTPAIGLVIGMEAMVMGAGVDLLENSNILRNTYPS